MFNYFDKDRGGSVSANELILSGLIASSMHFRYSFSFAEPAESLLGSPQRSTAQFLVAGFFITDQPAALRTKTMPRSSSAAWHGVVSGCYFCRKQTCDEIFGYPFLSCLSGAIMSTLPSARLPGCTSDMSSARIKHFVLDSSAMHRCG